MSLESQRHSTQQNIAINEGNAKDLASGQSIQLKNGRPEVEQNAQLKKIANKGVKAKETKQLRGLIGLTSPDNPIQKKDNNTGLPDSLKSGVENLGGVSLDDVKVHRNSDKPAQLNAHAYAQGSEIHLGPGQEKHLPHEAWHVVQQKQGRVKPTTQLKEKVNINDDPSLEKEADVMGEKAARIGAGNPVQKKDRDEVTDKVAQRNPLEEDSGTKVDGIVDGINESLKTGAGAVAVVFDNDIDNVHSNNSGITSDFFDAATSFKKAYEAGKKFWADDPKEFVKGAKAFAEGSKGILSLVKASIQSSSASESVKNSSETIIPGIGAGIGVFVNVMDMMQNQATWELVIGLEKGTLTDKEKETVSSFVKRLDAKLGLDIVDFIFNIAEVIGAFTGTGPAVALVHSCFNVFKGACEITHGYFAAKGLQADQRVTGGEGDVDREEMAALDLHLKESDDGDAKASKSIFGMIKSYGAIKALQGVISEGAQQKTPDEDKLSKDREMLALRKRILKIDLAHYNKELKPAQVSDPNSMLFGKVSVPPLTEEQIPTLYKIHMNVIRQIIKQAQAGAHGYSKLKAMTFGVKKDEIFAALEKKLGVSIDDSLDDWKLLSAMDPEQAGYFNEKTKKAIHVASKRKYFGDDEIAANLQKILIEQRGKFLPLLAEGDATCEASMDDAAYEAAIKKKVKF